MGASSYVHVSFETIVKETERALLVRKDDESEFWVPKACVADAGDYQEGDGPGTISISEKFANEQGIEGE